MTGKRLGTAHANSLASTLRQAIDFASLAHQRLDDEADRLEPPFPTEVLERLRSLVARIDAQARSLMAEFEISRQRPSLRGRLRGYFAILWSNLVDTESGPMRRYGAPPEWYAAEIDPRLKAMEEAAREILYLSSEPEAER